MLQNPNAFLFLVILWIGWVVPLLVLLGVSHMTAFNLEGRPGWKAQNGPRSTSLVAAAGRRLGLSSSPLGQTGFLTVMSAVIPENKRGSSGGPPLQVRAPEFTQHCFPIFY